VRNFTAMVKIGELCCKRENPWHKLGLNHVLNVFTQAACSVSGVFHQPRGKLLTLVGVTGKTLCFLIPQPAVRAWNVRVALHFSSSLCQSRFDLLFMNCRSLLILKILGSVKLENYLCSLLDLMWHIPERNAACKKLVD
jgi:hypothetical protein